MLRVRGRFGNRTPRAVTATHSLGLMANRTPTTVWLLDAELVSTLDARLGPPVDSYLNGSQTWLTPDGPGGIEVEWRLHPVAGYELPPELSHYDLWETVVGALAQGADPEALTLGEQTRALSSLWDGLECFPAYGDEAEPAPLAAAVAEVLGRPPDLSGLVDHEAIGDEWEKANGAVSIVSLLVEQLRAAASS
jgi:hypothetical protein